MTKTNNLPYFKIKSTTQEKTLANFLLRKFRPEIRKKFPQHYLVRPIPYKTLMFVKDAAKKHPYFLKFDIKLYYPSINHQILIKVLPKIYQSILKKSLSRRFRKYLKNSVPKFLSYSPYGKGLSIGSRLSWILAGIFLLDLDLIIPCLFLRHNDDYLIFCKRKDDAQTLLKNIILPKLKALELEMNEQKLKSGKFHQNKLTFLGFEFYAGYIRISEEKIEEFKQRIKEITYLTRHKSRPAIIKLLNNQVLGFGHYYKFASCKNTFQDLDAFIRARLRRYINRNKDSRDKQANLVFFNSALNSMGLKSLLDIYCKYASKKKGKSVKTAKSGRKSGQRRKTSTWKELEERTDRYRRNQILNELKELTILLKKIERRTGRIERKLDK